MFVYMKNETMTTTRQLTHFISSSRWEALPSHVQHESVRAFINWLGCAYGGANHPAVDGVLNTLQDLSVGGPCKVIGRKQHLDPLNAALVNGLSVSVHAFDDAHLATVAHPGAPTIAALLAHASQFPTTGSDFLQALIISYEIQCRLSCALAVAPATCDVGWYMTGVTGAVGVAAGVGKLMGLSEQQLAWAMGMGAMQASGLRASHGTMACAFIPADAGRNGLLAARLAANNFTCHEDALTTVHGLLPMLGHPANPDALTDDLGQRYECLNVSLKPFPSGCLTHAVIDACLTLVRTHVFAVAEIVSIELEVNDLSLNITGRKAPLHTYDAQASIFHWAAAVLYHRRAGLYEAGDSCVHDPAIINLRDRVTAKVGSELKADEARVAVTLLDGRRLTAEAMPCIGSVERPMSDETLQEKFLGQAAAAIGSDRAAQVAHMCWLLNEAKDVAAVMSNF